MLATKTVSFCRFMAMEDVGPNLVETMTEAELVSECRNGNEEAFVAIYQRHRLPVFQFAWRLTGSQSEA